MRFEWDESKRLSNLEKHGLDFREAAAVFGQEHVIVRSAYRGEEERLLAIGTLDGRFVTAVHTMRSATIRIISLRRATREERQKYQKLLGERA
jgi:uncharacterized DUF497 family protein